MVEEFFSIIGAVFAVALRGLVVVSAVNSVRGVCCDGCVVQVFDVCDRDDFVVALCSVGC